jgi:ferredoxin-NADP reductase/Na+-transporting NADH:ubiquinone oxidoreductase subunit NqrB
MFNFMDYFLDRITMYRLLLYYLIVLEVFAAVLSLLHIVSYSPLAIAVEAVGITVVCWITNKVFSWAFAAPTNVESVYITALILSLIITPSLSISSFIFYVWAGVLAMASKYILAVNKKHIFNPAAIAVVLTAYGINHSATWWVGNAWMMPLVVIGGLLLVRKIRRGDLVFSFFIVAVVTIFITTILRGGDVFTTFNQILLHSSLFFFAFVMLTEPLTTPPTRELQILYGGLVGFLFAPDINFLGVYSTPELALVVGNVFSYVVSPKQKLLLRLQEKIVVAPGMLDFLFLPSKPLTFKPGQYMEWTLQHPRTDSRGNRRYFTIASSPTEETLRLGVRINEKGSSFKQKLTNMFDKDIIVGGQLAGDFTLPKNPQQKCVFMAGGIGITPYRSMIKYLLDTKQARPIVMFYSNKTADEIMYRDVFDQAAQEIGIKTVYTLTDQNAVPSDWQGQVGRVTPEMIMQEVPDYKERIFYLSGPQAMVKGFDKTLRKMGVAGKQIKTDYFPGLA